MSSRTSLTSSGVAFSKSTQRKRLVSASKVGIRNASTSLLWSLPCVVNAKDRIIVITKNVTAQVEGRRLACLLGRPRPRKLDQGRDALLAGATPAPLPEQLPKNSRFPKEPAGC